MTPDQLRRLADKLDADQPPASIGDGPGEFVLRYSVHLLARSLREMADEDSPKPGERWRW